MEPLNLETAQSVFLDTATIVTSSLSETSLAPQVTAKRSRPCHKGMKHAMNHDMSHSSHTMKTNMEHDMPGMKMCKMSMTLNSDYENLCILSDKLIITTKTELLLAMVGICLFTLGYEYFKVFVDRMQKRYSHFLESNNVTEGELKKYRLKHSLLYGIGVGYSFLIMLLFMTFNTWVMLSVCVGAAIGHYIVPRKASTLSLNCH
ncbi:uncharacterized protein C5L36_0A10890 [Pichia kudriavzevii]|uniref:Copper transport protein n=1 Tax=Pichia kudriavzevii TaxID=4909 RepID=A0A099P929_PICKU|nr:uncharacterized protein C5L36_0A10890 [Pichia kudriavzevii]AWU74505.1 hypothetical protein C5L36_0A10890 [Pichia kudriavzevii]KGK40739.1 hypothetical protein JL09_g73 [Pichia kudriavzevii]ONH74366.1 Copper transport protein CTR2 [Pichia kudriavzevii]